MSGNKYYVKPAVIDASPIMQGIGSLIKESRDKQKSEKLKAGLMQAYQSGDPAAVAEFMSGNPDATGALDSMLGFRSKASKANYVDALKQSLTNPSDENIQSTWGKRVDYLKSQGIPSDESAGAFDNYMNDKDGAKAGALMELATLDNPAYKAYLKSQGIDLKGDAKVQSAKQLPGGLVQLVMSTGEVKTVPPNEADELLIKEAEKRGVDLQGQRSQSRTGGKGAANIGLKAFDQIGKIRGNIARLRQVVSEVKAGAETGPISDLFPSFKAETVRLNNLQRQLGLDVIGAVTFGALSQGELDLALQVALPTNLDGPELVQWANDKIAAQEKLAGYMEKQADFLLEPGNTVPDWIRLQRSQNKPTNQPGSAQQVGGFSVEVVEQ